MKKIIDLNRIQKEAKAKQISQYILIKRELNYRKVKPGFTTIMGCQFCHAFTKMKYQNRNAIQCKWIGIMNNKNADIQEGYICNFFKRLK